MTSNGIQNSFSKSGILLGLLQIALLLTDANAFIGSGAQGQRNTLLSSSQKDETDSSTVNRREAIINVATTFSTITSGASIANADTGAPPQRMGPPLFTIVKQLETANYMGQIGQPIYRPNVNGDPEKHLPKVKIDGQNIEVSVPHVMTKEHFIQYMWLKDVKDDEVVLVKEFSPSSETGNPTLKAKVPPGVELQPHLFCNLHGLWKGEPFVVS
jgi:desulfoferrodoxin (superoxide reductase-like protein)